MVGGEEIGNTQPSRLFQCVFNIHSPEPQMCLGELGKAFLITIVFAKVKKSNNKKQKQTIQKNQKKKKKTQKKRVISWPLLQTPERGGGLVHLGLRVSCQADLWTHRGWLLSPAFRCGGVVWCW